jgi:hypothetical protein
VRRRFGAQSLMPDVRRHETRTLCLIFDLDGTLVDSEALCNQAFLDLPTQLDDSVRGLMKRAALTYDAVPLGSGRRHMVDSCDCTRRRGTLDDTHAKVRPARICASGPGGHASNRHPDGFCLEVADCHGASDYGLRLALLECCTTSTLSDGWQQEA